MFPLCCFKEIILILETKIMQSVTPCALIVFSFYTLLEGQPLLGNCACCWAACTYENFASFINLHRFGSMHGNRNAKRIVNDYINRLPCIKV